jgi:hypothetical protein
MGSPTVGAPFDHPKLAIVVPPRAQFGPADDVCTENPVGTFRGLAFAMVFNVLLVLAGAAAWGLWRMIR